MKTTQIQLAEKLEAKLLREFDSPIITGDELRRALGFKTMPALRQAINRNQIDITIFQIDNRKGKYAFVHEVAEYLARQAMNKGDL